MERLMKHIEELLLWHDCVIIPEFGGFVLQTVSSEYASDEHLFIPTRKEVVFNPTLTHNDGLLAESYMQELSVDFSRAQQQIRTDVAMMKDALEKDLQVKFGQTGHFTKDGERVIFKPSKNSDKLFCTSSYGLPAFYYLSLTARRPAVTAQNSSNAARTETDKSNRILYTIPITQLFVGIFAAALVAVILFFSISTPVKEVNRAAYSAGFIPPELIPKKTVDEMVFEAFTDNARAATGARAGTPADGRESIPEAGSESGAVMPSSATAEVKSEAVSSELREARPARRPPAASTEKSFAASDYYVIIASYNTRRQAQVYLSRLKGEVADSAGILVSDGKMRVYAQQFSSKKAASAYLHKIRRYPGHQQAWLYKAP